MTATATIRKCPADTPWCDGAFHDHVDPDEGFCDHSAGMVALTMTDTDLFIICDSGDEQMTADEARALASQLLAVADLYDQQRG